jgi:hypothetical protein
MIILRASDHHGEQKDAADDEKDVGHVNPQSESGDFVTPKPPTRHHVGDDRELPKPLAQRWGSRDGLGQVQERGVLIIGS